jgi:iron(III) transport system substrate-binding protein
MNRGASILLILALLFPLGETLGEAGVAIAQEVPKELLDAAKQEGKLLVYGSLEPENMKFVQTAFEQKYGVKVEYWRASSTKVLDRTLTEWRAGKPLYDVVLANNDPMRIIKKEGALAKYAAPATARYPDGAKDKDGVLSPPYRVSVISILYNTKLVKPDEAPKSLMDLTNPKWKGKIAMPDPTRHITTVSWLVNLEKHLGKDYKPFLQGLAQQKPLMVESFIPAAQKIISGETPIGISYIKFVHVFGAREGAPLDYVRLKPVLGDGHNIAVATKAVHPNAGRLFVNYFISAEGLRLLAAAGEFVLLPGVFPPIKDAEKLEIKEMEDLSEAEFKKWREEFKKIFF